MLGRVGGHAQLAGTGEEVVPHPLRDVRAVRRTELGVLGRGDVTEKFEREVAAYLDVPEVVAVESGTAALHLALLVL
ncbi:DegT/DnrJ/EryC1/StrS family aminotransferase [Streptomyces canus]|uniref:DegT/DnrJ/EryC1/StrS family aminotransferase n=1 Tax=Streptomyces canus TaxID=58343 RepID=UPI002E376207|nr:DegT/DnrJ/EryC1/StrS family aminotransferase [Streptomyces canus]